MTSHFYHKVHHRRLGILITNKYLNRLIQKSTKVAAPHVPTFDQRFSVVPRHMFFHVMLLREMPATHRKSQIKTCTDITRAQFEFKSVLTT